MRKLLGLLCFAIAVQAETVRLPGLKAPVEVLRDRWGIPHIYAQNQDDLFFANGYMNARDRLFQMDLWRRQNTGKLAEVLGPKYVERDRMALLFRFRGDWTAEWRSYAPDARAVLTAFTSGINAYIKSLDGKRPSEFDAAGFDPGLWMPEDCLARLGGMSIMRNAASELVRVGDINTYGLEEVNHLRPPEPLVPLTVPKELPLAKVRYDAIRDYLVALAHDPMGGSNNWVVDGTRTVSGKPLLASDPHRLLTIPSHRRTIHLTMPGWSAIGAHEPSLPGIGLGHNEHIAFGFTITGIDQEDLYIEKLNPKNSNQYWHAGGWKSMTLASAQISVKGQKLRSVELRYTVHGPVIFVDSAHQLAYSLRTVASEPGTAGYVASLSVARAKNWAEFQAALARFKTPSETMVYADRSGNIGWQVAGLTPVRKGWIGLLPVPGDGSFEWQGFLPAQQLPGALNPPKHFAGSANHFLLPPKYPNSLAYEWGDPYRMQRIEELLNGPGKFRVADFERMQLDITSTMARRFQQVVRMWKNPPTGASGEALQAVLAWDARLDAGSSAALIYKLWWSKLPLALYPDNDMARRAETEVLLRELETKPNWKALDTALRNAVSELTVHLGRDMKNWTWSKASWVEFRHPTKKPEWSRGRMPKSGDATTLNAFSANTGASYRQVIDLADWDKSTMMNAPGESGDPASKHYDDGLQPWSEGRYHPMAFSRAAVEAVTEERIRLLPAP
ncbi:MAG TPA: penicillin acylase family protein [Bryobacteraceae bacterium]|nr:penicillin acylase family protein [Bryobacteraceae bacterium]